MRHKIWMVSLQRLNDWCVSLCYYIAAILMAQGQSDRDAVKYAISQHLLLHLSSRSRSTVINLESWLMASLLIFFRFYLLPYYCHWECSFFFNLQSSNQLNNPPQFLNSITCILVIFHQKTHQVHTCFLSLFLAFSFVIMNKNACGISANLLYV